MDRERVLSVIAAFLEEQGIGETGVDLHTVQVTDYLQASLDAVELLMALEDELGLDELEIDLDGVAPKLIESTFGDLADEVVIFLKEHGVD